MTSPSSGARRGAGQALAEIQKVEAERMLGLPLSVDLSTAARLWVADGISTRNSLALAEAGDEVSDGVRLALFQQLAIEVGATFSSTAEARSFEAVGIIQGMTEGADVGGQLYGLSNGFTDEFVARFRRFMARLLHRES